MNFIEAFKEAVKGKRIRHSGRTWIIHHKLGPDVLANEAGETIAITDGLVCHGEWEVVPDPAILYSFAEAYLMMKQGKWMRYKDGPIIRARINGSWMTRNTDSGGLTSGYASFQDVEVENPLWSEVLPQERPS